MPLESPDKKIFTSAVGYAELGMLSEANDELEKIDPLNRCAPEILALRISIYQGLKKWELMRELAARLHQFAPNDVQWVISYAYAARRAENIIAARTILINSLDSFPDQGIIFIISRVMMRYWGIWIPPRIT
jgi:hypothetical protein